ncbi:MAG: Uma2 family endonuclease [Dehalococcoidia bacterium]
MTNIQTETETPPWAPTEDDLPDSDGMPLDNERQAVQISLLAQPAKRHFADRADVYVGANMFVYFSPDQVLTEDFRGPDVFVVTGTTKRERKSWVTWQEGKGPDLVIEILSESTQRTDRTLKKEIYATRLRVPEYFWYDPFSGERAGFILHGSEYLPLEPDTHDGLPSRQTGLTLVRWHGIVEDIEATWLRWATSDGVLIPTADEAEQSQRQRVERAEQSVAELEARLAQYQQRFGIEPGSNVP